MDLNQGLFQINRKCGYVLKPEILRTGESAVKLQTDIIDLAECMTLSVAAFVCLSVGLICKIIVINCIAYRGIIHQH